MMCLRDEQRVAGIDRIDVEEGDGLVGFEYPSRRNLAVGDLAEDAVRIVSGESRRALPAMGRFHGDGSGVPSHRRVRCRHDHAADEPTTAGLVGALIGFVFAQQGDHGHGGGIALADLGQLVDAGVAPGPVLEPRTDLVEQLVRDRPCWSARPGSGGNGRDSSRPWPG